MAIGYFVAVFPHECRLTTRPNSANLKLFRAMFAKKASVLSKATAWWEIESLIIPAFGIGSRPNVV